MDLAALLFDVNFLEVAGQEISLQQVEGGLRMDGDRVEEFREDTFHQRSGPEQGLCEVLPELVVGD